MVTIKPKQSAVKFQSLPAGSWFLFYEILHIKINDGQKVDQEAVKEFQSLSGMH
jgi:hypothetical protein